MKRLLYEVRPIWVYDKLQYFYYRMDTNTFNFRKSICTICVRYIVVMYDICDTNKLLLYIFFSWPFIQIVWEPYDTRICWTLYPHIALSTNIYWGPLCLLFLGSGGASSGTCLLLVWNETTATGFCGHFSCTSQYIIPQ